MATIPLKEYADLAAKDADSAARKWRCQRHRGLKVSTQRRIHQALWSSQYDEFMLPAPMPMPEFAKSQKFMASLSSSLTSESQAYGKDRRYGLISSSRGGKITMRQSGRSKMRTIWLDT